MKEIKIWKEDEETGFRPGAERYMMMLQEDIIRNGDPSRHQYPMNDRMYSPRKLAKLPLTYVHSF
jgi:hypothetical protein